MSKGVTMGMSNYGSVRVDMSATATECNHEELSEYVSKKLQLDINNIMGNVGQLSRKYNVIK